MKNIIYIVLFLLLLLVVVWSVRFCEQLIVNKLYAGFGNRDWEVALTNDYKIQKLNGREILLVKDGWSQHSDIVISDYILAFCLNDKYIGVKCRSSGDVVYFCVDCEEALLYGPYDKEAYTDFLKESNIQNLQQWISTESRPSNAIFE